MDNLKFNVGTLIKSEIEADPRDYTAEAVLPMPTPEQLANLPKNVSRESLIGNTYYQNGRGSCTAMGTTHSMLIQNVKELINESVNVKAINAKIKKGENPIELIWQDLWTKMGHDIKNQNDSGDYVENALNTAIKMGISGKDFQGGAYTYFAQAYSYSRFGTDQKAIDLMKYYVTKYPLIIVISGNNNTRQEMIKGEIKTIVPISQTNGAHCLAVGGYDEYGFNIINSRNANDGEKCMFKISYDNIIKMSEVQMLNWRYWQLFDKKDSHIDIDKLKEELKRLDNFEADINQSIIINKKLWDETNDQEYKEQLHQMNEVNRGKLNDIVLQRKKLVG